MDRNLKTLVAVACVAIISAVGYFFWGEWSQARADAAANEATVQAAVAESQAKRDELFTLAHAADQEQHWVEAFCRQVRDGTAQSRGNGFSIERDGPRVLSNCRELGYL